MSTQSIENCLLAAGWSTHLVHIIVHISSRVVRSPRGSTGALVFSDSAGLAFMQVMVIYMCNVDLSSNTFQNVFIHGMWWHKTLAHLWCLWKEWAILFAYSQFCKWMVICYSSTIIPPTWCLCYSTCSARYLATSIISRLVSYWTCVYYIMEYHVLDSFI